MDKRTAEIIMVCKGQHDFGEGLSHKEAIAAYMADRCRTPLSTYTPEIINGIIWRAALDYIDSMKEHRPSVFLWKCNEILYQHDNPFAGNVKRLDAYDAICGAFADADVMDARGYINGFTENNSKLVKRMREASN